MENYLLLNICEDGGPEEFQKFHQKVTELGTYVDELDREIVDMASQGYVVNLVV